MKQKRSGSISIGWSLIWIFVHSFSVWLLTILLAGITNYVLYLLLIGLGITIIAKLVRSVTLRKPFAFNQNFIFWDGVHTLAYMIMILLVSLVIIPNSLIYYVIMGLGIFLITHVVGRLK
jgi:hypothetical protein